MKKLFALTLALVMALGLAACGNDTTEPADDANTNESGEAVTLRVGASPSPHAEILEQVKGVLAEEGITLEIVTYNDYIMPNVAVDEGEDDANYFQHTPYLDNYNAENGTNLVPVAKIHNEPMGIYAGKCDSLDALADGATVAVPNDPTNEGLECTAKDIAENPKNLQFKELEAAMLPQTVDEVDISVINSNYALEAGFNPVKDSLAIEDAEDTPYPNVLVVKEGKENDPAIQALVKALQSDAVREYIETTYGGAVVALF